MATKNLSFYGNTNINPAGYLDILKPKAVPVSGDDVLYEIIPAYSRRPDLLAHDLYDKKELWWVFAQRNPDILKEPIFDFTTGTKIYLPQGKALREKLGL